MMGKEKDVSQGDPDGVPMEDQVKHWEDQEANNIRPSSRTCKLRKPDGTIVNSPPYHTMTTSGTTAAQKAVRKEAGNAKSSATHMGHEQRNAIEGAAIHIFLERMHLLCPAEYARWTFKPVFDGNQADMMAQHDSWTPDEWMAIQIKSRQIQQTTYHLAHCEYDDTMNCVAIGMRDYKTNEKLTSADDTKSEGNIYELWNVGDSKNIETSLQPTPDVKYRSLRGPAYGGQSLCREADRVHFQHAD